MHPSARKFPTPVAPALGAGSLAGWFEELRAVDAEVTQYAVGIVREHFARAGREISPELSGARDWRGFGLYLASAVMPVIDAGDELEWIRKLFADLTEFGLQNPYEGSPDGRLAALLAQFLQWEPSYVRRDKVTALLPANATGALEIIARCEAEDQRRREESGY